MRWVKRIIILVATVVLLTIVVPVIGLQLWLANQSPRVQATTKASWKFRPARNHRTRPCPMGLPHQPRRTPPHTESGPRPRGMAGLFHRNRHDLPILARRR